MLGVYVCVCVCMLWCWNNGETAWLTAAGKTLATVQSPLSVKFVTPEKKSSHFHFVFDNVSVKDRYVGSDCVCVCVCMCTEGLLPKPQTLVQWAVQTSRSLSQDLLISYNDNHNILQTFVLRWFSKYVNKINQLSPRAIRGKDDPWT